MLVIRELVAAVQHLEEKPLPHELLDLYQPLESLSDCDLFQHPFAELEPKHIKVNAVHFD